MRNFLFVIFIITSLVAQKIIIPMDQKQNDHLKAYGIAFLGLTKNTNIEWLLNYRGGSFLLDANQIIESECRIRGVSFENVNSSELLKIYSSIEQENMDIVLLEKKPNIAIYTPPNKQPWDDAVTMALTYAEVDYETLWDEEVSLGKLDKYDWLHLHHEDFTGQYGKFYRSHHRAQWYKNQKKQFEDTAKKLGYSSVHEQKKGIVRIIKNYVGNGGFLFAMCSATDSYDIALASEGVDICQHMFDGDPMENDIDTKLNYKNTLAFKDFKLVKNPNRYEFSSIDATQTRKIKRNLDFFTLFDFSAKWDPIPTMLCQNHTRVVKGFMGQTTSFNNEFIKSDVLIMGETKSTNESRYIHGTLGNGTWTFYGGHDPEDYQHKVGDPKTDLSLHPNSAGYRLILNNILFPAAKKKKQKT